MDNTLHIKGTLHEEQHRMTYELGYLRRRNSRQYWLLPVSFAAGLLSGYLAYHQEPVRAIPLGKHAVIVQTKPRKLPFIEHRAGATYLFRDTGAGYKLVRKEDDTTSNDTTRGQALELLLRGDSDNKR